MEKVYGKVTRVLLVANLVFWSAFWASLFSTVRPAWEILPGDCCVHPFYITRTTYIPGAVPMPGTPFFDTVGWVQAPAMLLSTLVVPAYMLTVPDNTTDQYFVGLSVYAWRIILATILSFGQWMLIGKTVDAWWRRRRHHDLVHK